MKDFAKKTKEQLRRIKQRIRIKTPFLLVALVLLLFADATLMRFEHIRMTELRDAVLAADAADDDEALERALVALKDYVFSHMVINIVEENGVQRVTFGTGPFYLEHQYLRAATQALEEAEKNLANDSNPNGNIYAMAGETCRAQAILNGWSWDSPGYINCMMSEIQKYPAQDNFQDKLVAALPSTELYRRNYASPVWAPTLTGFLVILTLGVAVVILTRAVVWVILRLSLLLL